MPEYGTDGNSLSGRGGMDPAEEMRILISGYQVSQAIYVAAVLGLADLLRDGSASCAELASAANVDEDSLLRLLRALAGAGVIREVAPRVFETTPLGELLERDRPDSLHPRSILVGQEWVWGPWGRLLDCISTGEDAFRSMFGTHLFGFLQANREASAIFQSAMSGGTGIRLRLLEQYDFSWAQTVVDIGGGNGSLLTAIAQANSHVQGVLFEHPSIAEMARRELDRTDVGKKCKVVAGDFFEEINVQGDLYILSQVIHDWPDRTAIAVLSNCRRSMADDSKMLIIERSADPDLGQHSRRLSDLNMLVLLGGRERSVKQYLELLQSARLQLVEVVSAMDGWIAMEVTATT